MMAQRDSIIVEPWNPRWSADFDREAERLRRVLGDVAVAIHHIGSTAVAGLAAKPVIDVLIEAVDLGEVDLLLFAWRPG